ncbi:MAG: hypothetical protein LIO69_03445 [Oscillospiraceae bacterium]|nr:hypothetical protein [Oscillospiraceae bacterium]
MGRMVPVTEAARRSYNVTEINKKGKIPKKASIIPFVITLVAAVVARYIQLTNNIDWALGRYIDDSFAKNYPAIIIIVGMIITFLFLRFGSAKDKVVDFCILINPMRLRYDRLNPKISSFAACGAIIVALLVLIEIAFDIVEIVSDNIVIRDAMDDPVEQKKYNMLTGYSVTLIIQHVIMLMAALTFVCIAINIFKKVGFTTANCGAMATAAIWKALDVFNMAAENSVLAVSSEKVYEMFTSMSAAIFFVLVAKFFDGIEKKNSRIWLCFMGYLTTLLAAVSCLPRYFLLLTPQGYLERSSMGMPPTGDMGIMLFSIAIVFVFWSTYVYRTMPRMVVKDKRRWSKAVLPEKYQEMEAIDENDFSNDAT